MTSPQPVRALCGAAAWRTGFHVLPPSVVFQPDIRPMFAAVGCSVNAVPPIGRIPIVRFAAPNPNHIRIRWRNCDSADREHRLFVENRIERNAAVSRLENAAVSE